MPLVSFKHLAPVAGATALLLSNPAPAHDWPSPTETASRSAQATGQERGWQGLRWAGPQAGRPAAPSARDCRGEPARLAIPDGLPPRQTQSEPERALRSGAAGAERRRGDLAMAPPAAPAVASLVPPPAEFSPRPELRQQTRPEQAVAAGVVDDNADFGAFTQFHERHGQLLRQGLRIDQRVRLDVRDAQGRAVPDARVTVSAGGRELPLWARTDAGGQVWLMPQADLRGAAGPWEVEVSAGRHSARALWTPGQKDALQLRLPVGETPRPRLDLGFVIDATGSMGDEIDKLKASMRAVAAQIDKLPSRPDICWSLVAYRDRGDAFFVRGLDFTADLDRLQAELDALQAGGGGDAPEAANEALHTAIHDLSWRGDGTARLLIHLADAPPQQGYGAPHFNDNARAALARGIKLMSVGASGLDRVGEMAMRQMAQFTGGRFVFLTYANAHRPAAGPGRETTHEVSNYSVETLDKLIVRLVGEEIARWPT
jgi:Mg-chelatase subunit ChlD